MIYTNKTTHQFDMVCQDSCYFIVKAQFEDNSESYFSNCLDVNNRLQETKGIQWLINSLL